MFKSEDFLDAFRIALEKKGYIYFKFEGLTQKKLR